ncbi:MAG: LptF/LptG family permease [Flavobacteriaceae bacterium]|mgnify:FL=1|nr:LptF/LptG family permease [Flavobacteriaceae bacterium]
MNKIDQYILKKFISTYVLIQLLFIPIAIVVNLADNIDKLLEKQVPLVEILDHYYNFSIYFSSSLLPLFLFLAITWFTSKLSSNSEIIALYSSGVSLKRILKPYMIGSLIIALISLFAGMFIVPESTKKYNDFSYKYLKGNRKAVDNKNIFRKINEDEYIFLTQFNQKNNVGTNFTLENFIEEKLNFKISSTSIRYIPELKKYRLNNYTKRTITDSIDILENRRTFDTIFSFSVEDLTPLNYVAESLNYDELISFIEIEKSRGSTNIERYMVVKYKKWSIPFSIFILTLIGFAVSAEKRRGGTGVNLAFGIGVAMVYVFFDKIFGVLAQQSDLSPILAVWLPNILFGILAIYLVRNAKK